MIDVCFGESEKGSLKVAQKYNHRNSLGAAICYGYIGMDLSKRGSKKELKKAYREMFDGQALGGDSQNVISISFNLDIGSISGNVTEDIRKSFLFDMHKSPYDNDEPELEELEEYWNSCIKDLQKLIDCAKNGEDIRIWYSDAPYATCGLHFVMSQIYKYDCKITAIKLPSFKENKDGSIDEYSCWGEIAPGKFYDFLPLETEIPPNMRKVMAQNWNKLQEENATLRAVVNGKLISVSEDFYDYFIRSAIPNDEFILSRMIGEVLGKYQLGIFDWCIYQRIEKMIQNGEIEVIKAGDAEYHKILKKS